MRLVPADPEDLEDIAALVNRAYRGTEGWTHEGEYLGGQRTDAATLRADLAAAPEAILLTLREAPGGPLRGVVWLEPASGEAWYLGMLTVRPDLQDGRIGRRLLDEAEAYAFVRGGRRMRMTVLSVRGPLIAWYERRGYARTGRTEPFPYEDPRFGLPQRDDLVFAVLEKNLAPAGPTP